MLKLAVLGNPIQHSRSPQLHQDFARQAGMLIDYQRIEVPTGQFAATVRTFVDSGGKGFNITSPCKADAFALATACSEYAQQAQAVNTIVVRSDGSLYGDNTDGLGLVRDLRSNLGTVLRDKNLVVHGAGGAVRGILPALLAERPKQIYIINRTLATAQAVAQACATLGPVQAVPYDTVLGDIDVCIDGSSASCQNFDALHSLTFNNTALAYDLKYADQTTAFMLWAAARGIRHCFDGSGMLREQAKASFFLWTGFDPK